MAFLTNNKAKIHYELYGESGFCLVLINGFTRPCSDFRMIARFFSEQGFRVLTFDNRGAGQSESFEEFSLKDIADDINSLLNELSLESCHVLGFSMGGIIARCFAHSYPQKVKSLGLVASPFNKSFLENPSPGFLDKSEEAIEQGFAYYVADDFFKKNRLIFKAMAKKVFIERDKGYKKAFNSQKKAVQQTEESLYAIPKGIESVLVIHGDSDRVVPLEHARLFKENYPQVTLEILPKAGHLLLIEKTKNLYSTILSFLNQAANV